MKENSPKFKAHPWHGVNIGDSAPNLVNCYVEIVPTDTVKYEVDKETGHLKIDRPQKFSNQCPALYGFIPQTYCGDNVGKHCNFRTNRTDIVGDGDPLDICIFTEKPIPRGDILVQAIPIGGFRMIDRNQADDKIIAVLHQDFVYGQWKEITDCHINIIERLRHYFLTYKDIPEEAKRTVEITDIYTSDEAKKIISLSQDDYINTFI